MPVDGKLLEILCCPVSKTPLQRLEASRLTILNQSIDRKTVQYIGGELVAKKLKEALITADSKVIYPVEQDIPILLAEMGIGTTQLDNFQT
jgi:uncharacterized protein YbaR (Trm112 family)